MSNERIDLTQFEGISEDLEGEIYFLLKYADPYKPKVTDALIHLPKLITELKRCYELLDAAEETYESIGLCLYCDACETEHESHCKFASE